MQLKRYSIAVVPKSAPRTAGVAICEGDAISVAAGATSLWSNGALGAVGNEKSGGSNQQPDGQLCFPAAHFLLQLNLLHNEKF